MTSAIVDVKDIHNGYTRLSEKFKTYWTFHQFLQGIHKTFFGDVPGYKIDFQVLYDKIKGVTTTMTYEPPQKVLDSIHRFDAELEIVYRALTEDDRAISPNFVRRFFEKVRTEDEKLLMSLLRFYFHANRASPDALDKMDFLLTLVGTRKSLDDGRFLPRFPIELEKLFGGFLSLVSRPAPDPVEVQNVVKTMGTLKRELEECTRFEELSAKKILENIRIVKQRMGPTLYTVEVLTAVLDTNLAAKNKFFSLYEEEEKKILDSSRQLLEIEKNLETNPRYKGEDVQEEFRRFRQFKDDFEKQNKEKGVRYRDVTRLSDSIDQLLMKFDLAPEGSTPLPPPEMPEPEIAEADSQAVSHEGRAGHMLEDAHLPSDPLTDQFAHKVLYTIELIEDGTGSNRKVYDTNLSRLRLESWELRAARNVLRREFAAEPQARAREVLFFDAAVLRLKIDSEARALRVLEKEPEDESGMAARLNECGLCLIRAQELDRRFRFALEASLEAPAARRNELNRSRFRLLRGFAGLWLLHNTYAGI
ncbi:MAG: hypothetical protein ABIT01_04270 [Thermoanaerobaculia bacterium]